MAKLTMRKTNNQSLKEVIQQLIETYKIQGKLDEVRLTEKWESIMGSLIAKHTTDIRIYNKTLHINLDSPALKQELSYSKSKIIELLNKEFGKNLIDTVSIR